MIDNHDTIVAISTPIGVGAMSVIRLSGKNSYNILKKITHKNDFSPRYATLTPIYNVSGEIIDEAIVIYFKAPFSYTREEVCEIQCHGGTISARMILETCLEYNARLAMPGEFSKRAFLNGRIDLSQVNALSKIINAKNEKIVKILSKQLYGELGRFVDESRDKLLSILAHCEVMIDYSEEDIPLDIIENIKFSLAELKNKFQNIYEFSKMKQGLVDGYCLSIIGKPNVGKSSLLNAIVLYDRAIISPVAGTTRDTIEECINIDGNIIRLIDTAGIRKSQDEIEKIGIQKSIDSINRSDIILVVFDTSRELDFEDFEVIDLLNNSNKKYIIILNKIDLEPKINEKEISLNNAYEVLRLSSKNSQDCTIKIKEILSKILTENEVGDEILLTSVYQLESIKKALDDLNKALDVFENLELELFSYNINEAIANISSITKPYDISEMFDKMFGEFCLGK